MRLLSLTLASFRSYGATELSFSGAENVTVLLGENATGKTNLLEAISVLALLKSPRKAEDSDLIAWEQISYRVRGTCRTRENEERTLEVISQVLPRKRRVCSVNGVRTGAQEYIGQLPLVVFTPEDLTLFTGSPSGRRRLLDDLLAQVSPAYGSALHEYEKVLRQRNALLRHIQEGLEKPAMLDPWDEKLATLGALITVDRLQLIETLQMTLLRELAALGERPKTATFSYVRKGIGLQPAVIREEILEALRHYRERDIQILATTVGPHRDDWVLVIDGRELSTFASRGQQRAALLALLLLQASFLTLRTGEEPVLLLDDVFSEFDASHSEAVLRALAGHQVIITATHLEKNMREKARIVACPLA